MSANGPHRSGELAHTLVKTGGSMILRIERHPTLERSETRFETQLIDDPEMASAPTG